MIPSIAEIVRETRAGLGLSQASFGKRYSRNWDSVSLWERGKVIPGLAIMNQIIGDHNDLKIDLIAGADDDN